MLSKRYSFDIKHSITMFDTSNFRAFFIGIENVEQNETSPGRRCVRTQPSKVVAVRKHYREYLYCRGLHKTFYSVRSDFQDLFFDWYFYTRIFAVLISYTSISFWMKTKLFYSKLLLNNFYKKKKQFEKKIYLNLTTVIFIHLKKCCDL